jgi:subtilisin family serine protease
MHRNHELPRRLFAGFDPRATLRPTDAPHGPPFGAGDRMWLLDHVDPRFACDPLFDATEDLDDLEDRRRKRRKLPLAATSVALLAALSACAEPPPALHTGDAILVKLKPGASAPSLTQADDEGPPVQPLADLAAEGEQPLLRIPVPAGLSVEALAQRASLDDAVEYAEPVYLYKPTKTANDPRLKDLWGLQQIEAPAAWDKTTGDRGVVVAVVDDGVALTHGDLQPNLWTNPEEIAGNGKDDDGDGYVDDVHGYDFVDDDGDPSPASSGDDRWHGSHVSGTIGAAGNNGIGVAGVNWKVSLMALRAMAPDGGRADALARAIDYATDHGARVINASWGGGGNSKTISNAIARAGKRGVLFVAAAGNDAGASPDYPANLDLDNVLSVGALAPGGALADFSNRGALIAAPGVGILSTTAPGRYERYDGTSMATPHVSGIAALLWARKPKATLAEVRDAILKSGRALSGTKHGSASAARALDALDGSEQPDSALHLSRTELSFAATADQAPRTQVISVRSESGDAVSWKAAASAAWVELPRAEGTTPSRLSVKVDPSGLRAGVHQAKVTLTPKSGDPAVLDVTLTVGAKGAAALVAGPGCAGVDGRLKVKAGSICRLTAPGLDPQARAVGVSWRLPGGQQVPAGTFAARFVRRGQFALTVNSDDGEEDVVVDVE